MRSRAISSDKLTPMDYLLVVTLTFPVFGTFFPVESYLAYREAGEASEGGGITTGTLMVLFLLGLLSYFFAKSPKTGINVIRRGWPVLLFAIWCFITSRWAYNSGSSFNRSLRLFLFATLALYLVEAYDHRKLFKIIFLALLLSQLMSLLAIIGMPSLSRATDDRGSWRGAMSRKNTLGLISGLTFIFAFFCMKFRFMGPRTALFGMFLSLLLLLLSNNAGALIGAIISVGLLTYLLLFVRGTPTRRFVALLFGVLFAIVAAVLADVAGSYVLALFGRSSDLTGRDDVWRFVLTMISYKPLWGYGHSVWTNPDFQQMVFQALRWQAPNAHNGWLDIWLQLGIPGLAIFALIWIRAVLNISYLSIKGRTEAYMLFTTVFLFFSIRSYSETIAVDPAFSVIFWIAIFSAGLARCRYVQSNLVRKKKYEARSILKSQYRSSTI